jgi:AcrR family transcriptional regulator
VPPPPTHPRKRADAERNIARILDAAVDALAEDADVSMAEVARRAGVVRATIYGHFPTREALLDAVTQRAFGRVRSVIAAAEPERGDAADALARVVAATWQTLSRYHGLIAVNTETHSHHELQARHESVLGELQPLIERGQADGTFRSDVPAGWHLGALMALVHLASGQLRAGTVGAADAESALVATVLGAVAGRRSKS